MHTKAMSIGVSLASRWASVTCSARTGTENSATSLAWVTRRPDFRICSTCSGHGSMNVTSSPACTIWAPAYPPTAPAPTKAILRPILFLPACFLLFSGRSHHRLYLRPSARRPPSVACALLRAVAVGGAPGQMLPAVDRDDAAGDAA